MPKHALVIASETGLLAGADRDAERMRERLSSLGFAVDLRKGAAATREGILDGYAELTARAKPGDAAVVYYSGHGSWEAIPEGVAASGPFARRRYQGIVPFDYGASTSSDFRGILAEELSILLWKLTQKTSNVAVVLDCCHAALMSRDPRVVPKGLSDPRHVGVEAAIESILSKEDPVVIEAALRPEGSDAVRLVACRQEQNAYEHTGPDGQACGVFTAGLLTALDEASGQEVTWRDIGERAAEYVLLRFGGQLPCVEGRADRLLFALAERERDEAAPIAETLKGWVVRRGRVFGARAGDVYSIVPPAGQPQKELARARVVRVEAGESLVDIDPPDPSIPEGARAVQVAWAEPPRLVRVPADSERRAELVAAVKSPRLGVTDATDTPVVATVFVRNGKLVLLNREERPMLAAAPATADALARLRKNLEQMAQACALRELHGQGIRNVAPGDLGVAWGVVRDGEPSPLPLSGAALGPGDALYIKLANTGSRPLHVHILDVGVSDKVTLLTGVLWPMGVRLDPGTEEILFRDRTTGKISPAPFGWPPSVPVDDGPRPEEFIVVATVDPIDLTGLEQGGIVRGGPTAGRGRLAELLAQAMNGGVRSAPASSAPADDGVLTKRILFWASPVAVSRGEVRKVS